jgi:hypothetical protein
MIDPGTSVAEAESREIQGNNGIAGFNQRIIIFPETKSRAGKSMDKDYLSSWDRKSGRPDTVMDVNGIYINEQAVNIGFLQGPWNRRGLQGMAYSLQKYNNHQQYSCSVSHGGNHCENKIREFGIFAAKNLKKNGKKENQSISARLVCVGTYCRNVPGCLA